MFSDLSLKALFVLHKSLFLNFTQIPFSGRNPKLKEKLQGRPHVLVLNKADLLGNTKKKQVQYFEILEPHVFCVLWWDRIYWIYLHPGKIYKENLHIKAVR